MITTRRKTTKDFRNLANPIMLVVTWRKFGEN